MKRFFLAGLTTLTLLGTVALDAKAEPTALNPYKAVPTIPPYVAPSDLVNQAHRGYFKQQGIPGYLGLSSEYALGRVGAKELVQAAIAVNILPVSAATDRGYLNAVQFQLDTLERVR